MSGRSCRASWLTQRSLVARTAVSTPKSFAVWSRSTGSMPVTCVAPAAFATKENNNAIHQAVETRRPPDHMIALPMLGMPAGDHLTDDLVDRKAVHLCGTGAGVAGQPALGAAESRQVTAADAGGRKPQQNLAFAKAFRRLV